MNIIKSIGLFLLDFIETIVIALSIFVIVYIFLFQPHQVKGNSMLPNFENSEYLLTNKISYRFNEPKRGDVVVFKAPHNEEYDYIKRIVGLPNETVSLRNSQIFINDTPLFENYYLPDEFITRGGKFLAENGKYQLKDGEYFVLGDNRDHSSDSRDWGPVKKDGIIGKAWLIYWPVNRIGMIEEMIYSDLAVSDSEGLNTLPTTP